MKWLSLIFVCVVFACEQAVALPDVCEDLFSFACSGGALDDGTGVVQRGNSDALIAEKDQFFASVKDEVERSFSASLADPETHYFREMALRALHFKNEKICSSNEPSAKELCNHRLVGDLTHLVREYLDADGTRVDLQYPRTMEGEAQLQFVIRNHVFQDIALKASAKIDAENGFAERAKEVKDHIFPAVKKLLLGKIESLPISEDTKKLMLDKIESVQFKGTDCSEGGYALVNVFAQEASVDPKEMSFRICRGFLNSNYSEFTTAQIIAHELAHVIDPCNLSAGVDGLKAGLQKADKLSTIDSAYALNGLVACLRSPSSIGAKNKLEGASPRRRNQPVTHFDACDGDQITESVADWFANEVTTTYMSSAHPTLTQKQWQNGYANMLRALCPDASEAASKDFDEHPTTQARYNRLMLASPLVRGRLGCGAIASKLKHCEVLGPHAGVQRLQPSPSSPPKASKPAKPEKALR